MSVTLGVPLVYYGPSSGPRVAEGTFRGFICHASLIQREAHSDLITPEDWARLTTILVEEDDMPVMDVVWDCGDVPDDAHRRIAYGFTGAAFLPLPRQEIVNTLKAKGSAEINLTGTEVEAWLAKLPKAR